MKRQPGRIGINTPLRRFNSGAAPYGDLTHLHILLKRGTVIILSCGCIRLAGAEGKIRPFIRKNALVEGIKKDRRQSRPAKNIGR